MDALILNWTELKWTKLQEQQKREMTTTNYIKSLPNAL